MRAPDPRRRALLRRVALAAQGVLQVRQRASGFLGLRGPSALSGLRTPGAAAPLALAGCGGRKTIRGQPVAAGATVLALGDSLTHGTGAPPEASYPAVLARLTGWKVVNAGVPGDTTALVLERTPTALDEHRPALVLLGIGGNDRGRLRAVRARARGHGAGGGVAGGVMARRQARGTRNEEVPGGAVAMKRAPPQGRRNEKGPRRAPVHFSAA